MSFAFSLARAGQWLLDSGIQDRSGGVARYYQCDIGRNKPISTEITGYTASTLMYLFHTTGEREYLERAQTTVRFLVDEAWDPTLRTFPFEHPSPSSESRYRAYFFDCGIIIRGLMAVWRHTQETRLLDVARVAAESMTADFRCGGEYHPIIDLPAKTPLRREEKWSRAPGCYQLKAALAWRELAVATGDSVLNDSYLEMVDATLATHSSYLPGATDPHETMDRLHAYCYFLEGLMPLLGRADCAEVYRRGMSSVSRYLREIAPSFARSDVYAQLLRARIFGSPAIKLNAVDAAEEAEALAAFQAVSEDKRVDGGFFFGRREGEKSPQVNPVSTAFGLQALEAWREFQTGGDPACLTMLI